MIQYKFYILFKNPRGVNRMMKSKLELKEESGEVKKKKAWKKPTLEVVGNGVTSVSGKNSAPTETLQFPTTFGPS